MQAVRLDRHVEFNYDIRRNKLKVYARETSMGTEWYAVRRSPKRISGQVVSMIFFSADEALEIGRHAEFLLGASAPTRK